MTSEPNPLLALHRRAEAEFLNWADVEIVETFGQPQAEYAALRKSCGMMDLPQRGILELTGNDRLPFLNNLITNQVWDKAAKAALSTGRGIYAFLLNLKGRLVADMNVLAIDDGRTWIETDARLIPALRVLFEQYQFAEKVTFADRTADLHLIGFHGPLAASLLGIPALEPLGSTRIDSGDCACVVFRDDHVGTPGYLLAVAKHEVEKFWMHWLTTHERKQLRPVGWAAFNTARIEAGRAMFGIDFDGAPVATAAPGKRETAPDGSTAQGALAPETSLFDRAVSVTKGCYLGQEIVARMHARQQVARQVVGMRVDGQALPIAGSQVLDESGNAVGVVTSSTISPLLSSAAIALALVKRPMFEVGTRLQVPAEGALHPASVVELPFVKS